MLFELFTTLTSLKLSQLAQNPHSAKSEFTDHQHDLVLVDSELVLSFFQVPHPQQLFKCLKGINLKKKKKISERLVDKLCLNVFHYKKTGDSTKNMRMNLITLINIQRYSDTGHHFDHKHSNLNSREGQLQLPHSSYGSTHCFLQSHTSLAPQIQQTEQNISQC